MFSCKACKVFEGEIKHLREENQKLIDRLTALVSPQAYGAVYAGENKTPVEQDEEEDEGTL